MSKINHDRHRNAGKATESTRGDVPPEFMTTVRSRPAWSRAYAQRRAAEAQALIDAGKITVTTLPPARTDRKDRQT